MKKSILIILTIAAVLSLTNCRKNKTDIVYDRNYTKKIKELRKEIFFYLTRNSIPGGNFAVSIKGKTVYSEGLGLASTDLDVRVNRNTKFRIGETTELLTALAFGHLVENGILKADSAIQYYLPDYPVKQQKITLKNLVTHTTGYREITETEIENRGFSESLIKGIAKFKNEELAYYPGMLQVASPLNYNLLGAIMEKASGKKFNQLIKEYVTDTFKMLNTLEDNPFATIKGRSVFYDNNLVSHVMHSPTFDLRSFSPSKGFLSNAEDLLKLGNALLYSKNIPGNADAYLKLPELNGENPASFANGWIVSTDKNGLRFFGRTGKVTGGGSAILVFPELEIVVTAAVNVTTNIDELPVFDIAYKFIQQTEKIEEIQTEQNSDQKEDSTATK